VRSMTIGTRGMAPILEGARVPLKRQPHPRPPAVAIKDVQPRLQ
jgi:hypothetical protein